MSTKNPPLSASVFTISQHFPSIAASITALARYKLPWPAKLVGFSAAARGKSGSSPTLALDLLAGGVSVLSAPVSVADGSVTEASIATARISDEAVLTIDSTIGGTSTPTFTDVDVLASFVRV